MQFFGDILRNHVIKHLVPLVERFNEWAVANRQLIATRAGEYLTRLTEIVQAVVKHVSRMATVGRAIAPIILAAVVAFKTFSIAKAITIGVTTAMAAYNAALAAKKAATEAGTVAQLKLNAAMKANIIGAVAAGVILLAVLFMQLAQRVGGVGNAFIVVGQTIMKVVLTPVNLLFEYLKVLLTVGARIGVVLVDSFTAIGQTIMKVVLTPINLVLDGITKLLKIVSKIPGAAGKAAGSALEAVGSFQDSMNTLFTGSTSTLVRDGPTALLDPTRSAINNMPDRIQAADAFASRGVEGIQWLQDGMNSLLTGSTSTLVKDGPGFLSDPYRNARETELARREAAKETVGDDDDSMKEVCILLQQMLNKQDDQIDATNNLADNGPGSPASLRWGAMGTQDFWEIQKIGI
jgi:hypothetical protein